MYLFLFLGISKVETSPLTPVRSKEVWLLPLFLDGFRYSLRCINKRRIQLRGGANSGKVYQMFLQPPKLFSSGRLRLAALGNGVFVLGRKLPPCSRVSWGRLTAFLPQISKLVGPVMATGVLTVARFVGKVGCYLLVASLSGRLRASLSGRLTAFLPPDHKANGFRHCDGGTHGGEICWESRMLPLGCESLRTPQGVPLGTPHGVPPPRSQSRRVPSSRRGCTHGGEICWESRKLPPWSRVSRDASGRPSRDASRRSTPQITKPVGPVIATGVYSWWRDLSLTGTG